jgi:O-antigen ligase
LADRAGWPSTRAVWGETARIARDFPLVGAGLGSFATIHPYYKTADASPTTALSSLLQWCAEAGLAGVVLVVLAGAWIIVKLPGAVRRVGSADRALAFGLLGALAGFAVFSAVHWTIELAAVALAASAVGGTCHRWLAGGTDLFVARA